MAVATRKAEEGLCPAVSEIADPGKLTSLSVGRFAPGKPIRRSQLGQEVRDGDPASDLAGEDQIGQVRLSEDGGRGIGAVDRVRIRLELSVDQVDDPVGGDACPGVDVALLSPVPGQAAF